MNVEMNMNAADRCRYIADLDLADFTMDAVDGRMMRMMADPITADVPPLAPDAPVAAVVGSAILGFTEGVSDQNRQDIMDCFLLAQLKANKEFANEVGSEKWFGSFRTVLNQLGLGSWNWSYSRYQSGDKKFTMDQTGLQVLASAIAAASLPGPATLAMLKVAADTIAALQAREKPLGIFERQARTHNGASFAMGACSQSATGEACVAMGAVSFDTASTVTNVLFWDWHSADVNVHRGEDNLVLNSVQYGVVREEVRKKLGDKAKQAIAEFDI
ncbi:hypothetical protein ACIPL1_06130 [Pseudomonas sp. NPDC090202]|uniref:hypothetical protein n=1 Tax=unclassified Pseudomonas TaxID=196821 RepID=UPI003815B931